MDNECCKKYANCICDLLDDNIPDEKRRMMMEHMESCEKCRVFFKTYCLTIKLSKSAGTTHKVSHQLIEKTICRIFEKICVEK